jgi:Arc/MetJ-type ribon-helix-helix transcriptional regulator
MSLETKYVTVSIPVNIAKNIDKLIDRLGYWPSRSAFVREACLQKIREEKQRLERNLKGSLETAQP